MIQVVQTSTTDWCVEDDVHDESEHIKKPEVSSNNIVSLKSQDDQTSPTRTPSLKFDDCEGELKPLLNLDQRKFYSHKQMVVLFKFEGRIFM